MLDSRDRPALVQGDIEWLACPMCRQSFTLESICIRCNGCNRVYPIVDGIPILLASRAY